MCTTSLCVMCLPYAFFLPYSPYAYGDSPWESGSDVALTWQQFFVEYALNQIFLHASAHAHGSRWHIHL